MLTIILKPLGRQFGECSLHVGSQSFRRLVGDLDAVLEDSDREGLGRHRAEVEAEVVVNHLGILGHRLDDLLHRQHPRRRQVAVLHAHVNSAFRVNSALHPSRVAKSSTGLKWLG